jgi:single-stranded-DNA-specific exonuclease
MKWLFNSDAERDAHALAAALRSHPALGLRNPEVALALATLLLNRSISDLTAAELFLSPSLSHLHSPYLMSGMSAAVDRLCAAIEHRERILIYGDYDVDGTTAIVILKTAIELCGGSADFHVPHRIRDGYGMKEEVIERAAAEGTRLIISVDTGIRGFAAADSAARAGVDLIVTDHHLPGLEGVPKALAVVNPNQPGCEYPCKALCGAGVAFKLAQGLMERKLDRPDKSRLLMSFMKVVAIATIADAVPLIGENRVFAKLGLEALRQPVNIGLKCLLDVAQVGKERPLTAGEVGFRIAPRLNAAGRMDVARDVVELFSVKDKVRAQEIATKLDKLNAERQEEERRILADIEARFESDAAPSDAYCFVIAGEDWHRGVIGITATRVVERHHRPTLVVSLDGGEAHGSGRSIRAFHLLDALESCRDLFTRYGGHSHAVGFSLPTERVPQLRSQLDAYARTRLTTTDFEPALDLDAELPLDQVTPELFAALRCMEPFGQGNPEPVFAAYGVRLAAPPRVLKERHLKLRLAPALGCSTRRRFRGVGPDDENGDAHNLEAVLATPRCHPDGSALRRDEVRAAEQARAAQPSRPNWRNAVTFDALAWHMAEALAPHNLAPGTTLDIAYTIGQNDHPDFGGLELSLRDVQLPRM